IPNRTVKQLCADDSAATSVKVGYRQACYSKKPLPVIRLGFFLRLAVLSADRRKKRHRYAVPCSFVITIKNGKRL
ncbi:hypothetical protein, partial [Janthinobacterium sp. SUN033]|uniref:hypothetical protein n=1 Tax=Janthinobacterium sp. SUN033 TaxID=3002439 RepID=UPI0025B1B814